jgi:hypothetical protein
MSKALISFGTNKHAELLDIALPSFKAFADRHDYDLLIPESVPCVRPPAWYKIKALLATLEMYDEAIFIGADLVIVDGSDDIEVPADYWQAMVNHHTGDGEVPNTDFWLCRKPMIPYLQQVWEMTDYICHGWWEQAALLDLMGYNQQARPNKLREETELYQRTFFLDNSWNVHKWDKPQPEHPRIQHATMYPDRVAVMREWAKQAESGWMND